MARKGAPRSSQGKFLPAPAPKEPTRPAPGLSDASSNAAYCEWVREQLDTGRMAPRDAEARMVVAAKHLSALRTGHGLNEVDELRRMVATMKAALDQVAAQASAQRHESGLAPAQVGRVKNGAHQTS